MTESTARYPDVEHPFREALAAIVGIDPPAFVVGYGSNELTEDQFLELQDWCSMNARPEWSTGIGIIEAAELMVVIAAGNANIRSRRTRMPKLSPDADLSLASAERAAIVRALLVTESIRNAAQHLRISRATMYRKLRRHRLLGFQPKPTDRADPPGGDPEESR